MKNNFGEQELVLCVPPSKIDIFLDQHHTSLLGGHSGITKCYQTLRQRIYCPNLPYYVRLYIISCHICQLFKNSKRFDQPLMRRFYDINTQYSHHDQHFYGHKTHASIKITLQVHPSIVV